MLLLLYIRALWRSLDNYDSDMGGWRERLQWEIGFAEGSLGLPCRNKKYNSPYEHGHYTASQQTKSP